MKKGFFKILISLIFVANLGFAEYVTEGGKIYYNEDYHKTLVVKRIDDEKSEKYLTKSPDLKSFKILNENFAKDKDEAMDEFIDALENIFDAFSSLEKSNEIKKSSITVQDKNHKYEYCNIIK
jgi:putative membrane protein